MEIEKLILLHATGLLLGYRFLHFPVDLRLVEDIDGEARETPPAVGTSLWPNRPRSGGRRLSSRPPERLLQHNSLEAGMAA